LLKVSVSAAAGGERILAILGPGSIVGELSMIDGAPRSASVSALRDAKLRFVSRAAFEAFGRSNPEVHRHVMILLARRLRDTNDALAATSFLPVKGRVARVLLNLAEAFGRDVGGGRVVLRQKVTQSDLAAMAGIARENVSRILKEWMDRKLLSRLAGYYCLENRTAISEASGGLHWRHACAAAADQRSLPDRRLGHGSNSISFTHECSGACNHHFAFRQALPDLRLAAGEEADADLAGFDAIVANHLNDGAGGSVEHGRQRNRRAATSSDVDGRAAEGADAQLWITADEDENLAELCGRIDRD
jgi:CRP-like cAMP-binding protein